MKKFPEVFTLCLHLTFLSILPGETGQINPKSEIHPVMFEFSKAIHEIEKEFSNMDPEKILISVSAMYRACEDFSTVEPQKNLEISQIFDKYRSEIKKLISELHTQLMQKDTAYVPTLVQKIKQTCVSCHIKFREDNDKIGLFPSTGNVITGEVIITKLNGNDRIDRSNVVVFLDHVSLENPKLFSRINPIISQKNRQFSPRVLPIVKGTIINFPNDDIIFHNVFSLSKTEPFDLDIYPPGNSRSLIFNRTGWVKIYCNIHPQMISHVIVLDNPYFDLTDEKGLFVISDVPDGEYTIRIWHEYGSEVRKKIQLSGSSMSIISFDIREDKKFIQHKTKFGKPYSRKYE
ncbi:MAG: hypothetical protein IIB95_06390 [Candidatus Marinimicrobia bacterium]|nr:hypothetical protein [Candidatus Neomarinimicrobiota bacterium]